MHARHDQRITGVEGAVVRHEEQIQGLAGSMHNLGLRTDALVKQQGKGSCSQPEPSLRSGYSGIPTPAPGPVSSSALGPSPGHSASPATVLPSACFTRPLAAGAAARSRCLGVDSGRVLDTCTQALAGEVDAKYASLLRQLGASASPSLPVFEQLRRGEHPGLPPAPSRGSWEGAAAASFGSPASSGGSDSSQTRGAAPETSSCFGTSSATQTAPAASTAGKAGSVAQGTGQAALAAASTAERRAAPKAGSAARAAFKAGPRANSGAAAAAEATAPAAASTDGLVMLADAGQLKQQVLSCCLSSTEGRDKRAIARRLQATLPPEHKVDAVNLNKMVNRLLYQLQKEGKARSLQEDPRAPPLWTKV